MTSALIATKLFIPTSRPHLVSRPRLIEALDGALQRKLTLVSAPAGFGKTTLVTEWLDNLRGETQRKNQIGTRVAWLSIDEGDNNPLRFLTYFISALNRMEMMDAALGTEALAMLQSPQPLPTETTLISLINEVAACPEKIVLVLDDYHLIDSQPIHDALSFLLENIPPQMHLVIATREDPLLPLSRLRARDQLTELRAADLRFTSTEAAKFLNHVMGLDLSTDDIAALEERTEGWIAGLQLAAISMRGSNDTKGFVKSFTGSHRYVAERACEHGLQLAKAYDPPMPVGTEDIYAAMGDIRREQGDLEAAAQDLQMGRQLGEQVALPDWQNRWYIAQSRLEMSLGNLDDAIDLLEEAARVFVRTPVPEIRPIAAVKAGVWVKQGKLTEALDWGREKGLSFDDELSYLREFEHITLARVLIAQYKRDGIFDSILQAVIT